MATVPAMSLAVRRARGLGRAGQEELGSVRHRRAPAAGSADVRLLPGWSPESEVRKPMAVEWITGRPPTGADGLILALVFYFPGHPVSSPWRVCKCWSMLAERYNVCRRVIFATTTSTGIILVVCHAR